MLNPQSVLALINKGGENSQFLTLLKLRDLSSTQQKYSNLQMGITFNQEFLWRFFLFFVSNESIDLSVVSAVNDKVLK